ncbi:MAG: glycosyltransferase family 2 protein [Kofleriaceae bacterium]|nr:glycosyltransferase family 2 protein [Kofleriaceae bacterium]MBP6837098.1 glycosyltransferase family 2 protein [Kofleriaceae bacterium]MBP9207512.1 glycosyltransferase family 2 protein [Kofleriaceae bacterium]
MAALDPTAHPDLAVVIPAFNEEARLGPTVTATMAYLRRRFPRPGQWQLLIADDGSKDGTRQVALTAAEGAPEVSVITLPRNRGKGAAVRTGMLAATAARVLFADADLATPIEELDKLMARLDAGADIAIGSRALASSDIQVRQHPIREFMGRGFNTMVRVTLLGGIRDTQCGFKLFTRAAAQDLFGRATIDGFAFDVEVLWLARGRYRVDEVPIVWRHVEQSKVSPGTDAARMFLDILRIRRRHRR